MKYNATEKVKLEKFVAEDWYQYGGAEETDNCPAVICCIVKDNIEIDVLVDINGLFFQQYNESTGEHKFTQLQSSEPGCEKIYANNILIASRLTHQDVFNVIMTEDC